MCELPGRYVTIEKPGGAGTELCLRGVAVFLDCDSPLIFDSLVDFPSSFNAGDSFSMEIPLATALENALETNICGQLEV